MCASYGRLLAILSARASDIAGAEDALADALARALDHWPRTGIPDQPEAWLLTTARRRLIDMRRKAARVDPCDALPEEPATAADPHEAIPDERLKLMFVCAHPAIDPALHTPLMLQTVLGLEADRIGAAFLISPNAMAQRLVRVKRKIKAARIPFRLPDEATEPNRLTAVLEAIYGAFSLDWLSVGGPDDLRQEAAYLATLAAHLSAPDPEALGLQALICFVIAREPARLRDGMLVPVPEQDTALWDTSLIDQAAHLLTRAAQAKRMGRFQLEAAIQSVHAARAVSGQTDWRALSQLYAGLRQLYPTVGAAVSHAAAVGEDAGPVQGLALLDQIAPEAVAGFQPAWAVRAHLLARSGDVSQAATAYDRAIVLATDVPSRRWLEERRMAILAARVI
nr:DUF6596 domain-containing protein [Actibacterium sp. 188UL27-1]